MRGMTVEKLRTLREFTNVMYVLCSEDMKRGDESEATARARLDGQLAELTLPLRPDVSPSVPDEEWGTSPASETKSVMSLIGGSVAGKRD